MVIAHFDAAAKFLASVTRQNFSRNFFTSWR
jgi:hypothetical protein